MAETTETTLDLDSRRRVPLGSLLDEMCVCTNGVRPLATILGGAGNVNSPPCDCVGKKSRCAPSTKLLP